MSEKLVTPEQELIAAVIGALQLGRPLPESVDAILTTPSVQAALAKVRGEERAALDVPASLSSYLGAGIGDDSTTAEQYDARIRWGIDHLASVFRTRAANVIEECSKERPRLSWGEVKRAVREDTFFPEPSDVAATPKPEPVLRWEGDNLMLGEVRVATVLQRMKWFFWEAGFGTQMNAAPTLTEARTAAEQAVRNWLKRAGVV